MLKRGLIFLDRLYWLWLALAAPFLLFPSPKGSLILVVIPALFVLHWVALRVEPKIVSNEETKILPIQQSGMPSTPFNGALLLLAMMVLVSIWATFDIVFSLPKISGIVLGLGVFFAIVRAGKRLGGWFLCLLVFLGTGAGIGILGLLGSNWTDQKLTFLNPILARLPQSFRGWQGVESGFNPNEVAGALIWVLPLFMTMSAVLVASLFQKSDSKNLSQPLSKKYKRTVNNQNQIIERGSSNKGKYRLWRLICTIFLLFGTFLISGVLLFTQSRSGYIGMGLILPVLCFLAIPTRWRGYYLGLLVLLIIILGLVVYSQWATISTWFTGDDLAAIPSLSLNTLQGRLEIWSRAVLGIRDFPLTGMGMNSFRKVVTFLYPFFIIPSGKDIGHAHNEFLQAALDLGIPGLIAFLALNLIAFRLLVQAWATIRKTALISQLPTFFGLKTATIFHAAILGLGGGLVAHIIYGLTDAVSLGAKPSLLFWMLLALICGLHAHVHSIKKIPVPVTLSDSQ